MGQAPPVPDVDFSGDDLILAAAYQADRLRCAAGNLAVRTVDLLKTSGRRGETVAACLFAEAAVKLATVVIWNEVCIFGQGPWSSRAFLAEASAWDLVETMPEIFRRATSVEAQDPIGPDESRKLAVRYGKKSLAQACLEIRRLIPDLFEGPHKEANRKRARLIWRRFHNVPDPSPEEESSERCLGHSVTEQAHRDKKGRPRICANSERDAWLYDRMKNHGRSSQEACDDLGDEGPRRGWSIVENRESVYQAVKKYAARNDLPPVSVRC